MWGWLREYQEIKFANEARKLQLRNEQEYKNRLCESCEVLKLELAKERLEKQRLLDHILQPKAAEPERLEAPSMLTPIPRGSMNWKVKQQMLEAEDRAKHQIMQEFKKKEAEIREGAKTPVVVNAPQVKVEDLEKTLGIVEEK